MYGLQGSPPHTRGKDKSRFIHGNRCRITPAHAGKRLENRGLICGGEDHPRTRGEKSYCAQARQFCTGSPPHTRGKGRIKKADAENYRITPAHAGKSIAFVFLPPAFEGSPPHTRGKGRLFWLLCQSQRITPAHAGKSEPAGRSRRGKEDHPRTRGEKVFIGHIIPKKSGSPPHTRGKVMSGSFASLSRGITPAHAGKSRKKKSIVTEHMDHPRTRGEKGGDRLFQRLWRGSPPHTRGKVSFFVHGFSRKRITPAHAGKRYSLCYTLVRFVGSPPHTRGKVRRSLNFIKFSGITPAHAGKSCFAPRTGSTRQDHPRTRGEKFVSNPRPICSKGSPPHARGKAGQSTAALWCRGITPARAGKS